MDKITKNRQYYKFCLYGFFKNLRFFDAFFVLFLLDKEMSFTQIGILYAVREITINVFEIPSGIVADTFGRTKSLIASFLIYILSFVVFYFSGNFWLFMAAFVLYGIGDSFRTGTHKGIIIDYLKQNNWENQKINYYGHTRSWSQKGSAVSALIAGVLVFFSGNYDQIFLYSIIPYGLNLLLLFSYPRNLNLSSKTKQNPKNEKIRSTALSFFKVIKQPGVLKVVNNSALHTAYLSAIKDYIQVLMVSVAVLIPFLNNIDLEKKNGIIIGGIYFLIYIFTSFASKNASKIVRRNTKNIAYRTLLFGFVLGAFTGAFFYFHFWIISLLAFIGIYIVENLRKPILTGFVSDNVPNELLTSVISAQSLLKTIFTSVIAFFIGITADYFGVGIAFLAVSMLLFIVALGVGQVGKTIKRSKL